MTPVAAEMALVAVARAAVAAETPRPSVHKTVSGGDACGGDGGGDSMLVPTCVGNSRPLDHRELIPTDRRWRVSILSAATSASPA